jgi:hypothetical protein
LEDEDEDKNQKEYDRKQFSNCKMILAIGSDNQPKNIPEYIIKNYYMDNNSNNNTSKFAIQQKQQSILKNNNNHRNHLLN